MRTRKEIEEEEFTGSAYTLHERAQILSLEVLLDIRELLANPGVQNDWGKAKDSLQLSPTDV